MSHHHWSRLGGDGQLSAPPGDKSVGKVWNSDQSLIRFHDRRPSTGIPHALAITAAHSLGRRLRNSLGHAVQHPVAVQPTHCVSLPLFGRCFRPVFGRVFWREVTSEPTFFEALCVFGLRLGIPSSVGRATKEGHTCVRKRDNQRGHLAWQSCRFPGWQYNHLLKATRDFVVRSFGKIGKKIRSISTQSRSPSQWLVP
jgi:hypothetical protein